MKKGFFAIALSVMLVFSMMTSVFAAADNFVGSISTTVAPAVTETPTSSNPEWKGSVTVVASGEQSTLSEAAQAQMKAAYTSIETAADVAALSADVATVAAEQGVKTADLAISDLFDISVEGDNYGTLTISLKSDSFENFVALLHYTGSAWEVVKDAKVENGVLTFSASNFSPFAIVVSTEATQLPPSPTTGETAPVAIAAAAVAAGITGIVVLCYGRKKADED